MRLAYRIVDVFTETPLAGNQLAVFTDAAELPAELMQRLAREMNYPETTFVIGRGAGSAQVRIFTPGTELPFAGHPTLGTAAVLCEAGRVVLELGVGPVPVEVERTPYGARCELSAPPARKLDAPPAESLAAALGLTARDLDPSLPAEVWSCGNAFAFVPLRSRELVARARCPREELPGLVGVMPFALPAALEAHARVFCPGAGVPEDPATGSANAPFAAYLHAHGRLAEGAKLVTRQGVEMLRPSRLEARMLAGRPHVAGGVVFVAEGVITL
jgi:trans-2,3-dihydro-3-hydroxyanthranilate isomerase